MASPPFFPALELRIHGVHGTSPASMLGVDRPEQVAGDRLTGLYRTNHELPLRRIRDGQAVEAYSWGTLTSGTKNLLGWLQRALWLLLLPFALVNLAYWARLHVGEDGTCTRSVSWWGAFLVRLAGLLLTIMFVLTACLVSVDLVGWQCYRGGTKNCPALPGFLDFMMSLGPRQRISVAALGPLAVITVLWVLSFRTLARYEEVEHSTELPGGRHLLQKHRFWQGATRTRRLQRLHLCAAIATMVAFTGLPVDQRNGFLGPTIGAFAVESVTWIAAGALLLLALVQVARLHPKDLEFVASDAAGARERPGVGTGKIPLTCAGVLVVGHGALSWFASRDPETWDFDADWWGHNTWFIGVFMALTLVTTALFVMRRERRFWWVIVLLYMIAILALLVAAVVVPLSDEDDVTGPGLRSTWLWIALAVGVVVFLLMVLWHICKRRRKENRPAAWGGAAAALLVGAASWVALLFTTAMVTGIAEYLNGDAHSVSDLTTDHAGQDLLTSDSLTLEGDVVFREAVLELPRGASTVTRVIRGRIESSAAIAGSQRTLRQKLQDQTLTDVRLMLPDRGVELVGSCVRPPTPVVRDACAPGSLGYATHRLITLPSLAVQVDPEGRRVRLDVAESPAVPLVVPQVLIWSPMTQLLWLLILLVVAGGCYRKLVRQVRPAIKEQVAKDRAVPPDSKRAVTTRRTMAALAHRAERLLEYAAGLTVLMTLTLIVFSSSGLPPWQLAWEFPLPDWRSRLSDSARLATTVSLYVALGMSLALVALGSYLRRSDAARRAAGVLWDLTTFWPRAGHPLGPPCYAERVVPELVTRIRWALREENARVVVSAHSQGSLIAAATLIALKDDELERVWLITYGSQIRALYGRVFPRVFGPAVMGCRATTGSPSFTDATPDVPKAAKPLDQPGDGTLWARLGGAPVNAQHAHGRPHAGRWRNLFRRTDPLGYRVFSDADTFWDVPVPEVPPTEAGDPGPTVLTHSYYQHTYEYRIIVCGWLQETPVPPAAPRTIAERRPSPWLRSEN